MQIYIFNVITVTIIIPESVYTLTYFHHQVLQHLHWIEENSHIAHFQGGKLTLEIFLSLQKCCCRKPVQLAGRLPHLQGVMSHWLWQLLQLCREIMEKNYNNSCYLILSVCFLFITLSWSWPGSQSDTDIA